MKTNNNPSIQPAVRKRSRWPVALTIAAFAAILAGGIRSVQATTYPITFNIGQEVTSFPLDPTLNTFSPSLLGLSTEVGAISSQGGPSGYYWFAVTNTQFVNLVTNVGFTVLRLGGNSADHTNADITWPTTDEIDNYFTFAVACGLRTIYQLNLENGNMDDDAGMAAYMCTNFPGYVYDVAIGNEPNLYPTNGDDQWGIRGGETARTNFLDSYVPIWQEFARRVNGAIQNAGFADAIGGPDASNGGRDWVGWLANYENYRYGQVLFTDLHYHYDACGNMANNETSDQGLDDMLNSSIESSYQSLYNTLTTAPCNNYPDVDFTEYNGHVSDGHVTKRNRCDVSMGAALFLLDSLHWWGLRGLDSADVFEEGQNVTNSITDIPAFHACFYYDPSGTLQAMPQLYAYKAMAVGDGKGGISGDSGFPVTMSVATNSYSLNVTAYCVTNAADGFEYVTIINREHGSSPRIASVTIDGRPGNLGGERWLMYLAQAQNNLEGWTNVTLGAGPNNVLTGTNVWNGQWTRYFNGLYNIPVTNGTACIVKIE